MGIWVYDCGTKSWRTDLTGIWSSRPDVIIHTVAQDIEGRIWVGKDYDGIDVLEKETGKVTSLVAHDDNGRSLPHNTIYDLYADRDGIMWVGTYKKGVSYYSESIFKFNMYEWGDITCIEQADEINCGWERMTMGFFCGTVQQERRNLSGEMPKDSCRIRSCLC